MEENGEKSRIKEGNVQMSTKFSFPKNTIMQLYKCHDDDVLRTVKVHSAAAADGAVILIFFDRHAAFCD